MALNRTMSTVVLVAACIVIASFGPFIADTVRDSLSPHHDVTMEVDEGVNFQSGAGSYAEGEVATVRVDVKSGYYFCGWFDDDGRLLSENPRYAFVAEDINLHARTAPGYTLHIIPSEGIYGISGNGGHAFGEDVTVEASVAPGYEFRGWYGISGDLLSEDISFKPAEKAALMIARTDSSAHRGIMELKTGAWPSWYNNDCYCVITDAFSGDYIMSFKGKAAAPFNVTAGAYQVAFYSLPSFGASMYQFRTVMIDGPNMQHYIWHSEGELYQIDFSFSTGTYNIYHGSTVSRAPHTDSLRQQFIKSESPAMQAFAEEMLALTSGMTEIQRAQCVLDFVQQCIEYRTDPDVHGQAEYWKFPYETLSDRYGDCEDTAALYVTLMHMMGTDSALFLFLDDGYKGRAHIGAGVSVGGCNGPAFMNGGKAYYYCETTSDIFAVGDVAAGYDRPSMLFPGKAPLRI